MLYDTIRNEGAMQKAASATGTASQFGIRDIAKVMGNDLRDKALNVADKANTLADQGMAFLERKGGLAGVTSPFAGIGGLVGAATNDGNRAAGALGGSVGGALGSMASLGGLSWVLSAIDRLGGKIPGAMTKPLTGVAIGGLSSLAGGYGGGKLGAYLDRKTGSNLTKWTNKLLGRD